MKYTKNATTEPQNSPLTIIIAAISLPEMPNEFNNGTIGKASNSDSDLQI